MEYIKFNLFLNEIFIKNFEIIKKNILNIKDKINFFIIDFK